MLKTVSAKERAETYYKQNPRECVGFSRSEAKKETPGKVQVGMHTGKSDY